jgi:hypothetical protein
VCDERAKPPLAAAANAEGTGPVYASVNTNILPVDDVGVLKLQKKETVGNVVKANSDQRYFDSGSRLCQIPAPESCRKKGVIGAEEDRIWRNLGAQDAETLLIKIKDTCPPEQRLSTAPNASSCAVGGCTGHFRDAYLLSIGLEPLLQF